MKKGAHKKLKLLLLLYGVYIFSYFQRVAVPGPVFNELQSEFALSATAVAGLAALTFFIYGSMQLFAGMVSDRFGGFNTFLGGGVMLSLSSVAFSFSHSPLTLFVMRALVGFSASFIFISIIKILSVVYEPEDFPFYLGITMMSGYLGGVFATYPLERAVNLLGWRNAFLAAGLLCSTFTITSWRVVKNTGKRYPRERTFSLKALFRVLLNRTSLPVIISGPINFGLYFTFQTTLGVKYLQDSFGLTASRASLFTFMMILSNACFAFVSVYTSRLIGLRKPIIRTATTITLSAAILLYVNAAFLTNVTLVPISFIMLAVSAAASPVYMTTIKEINPLKVASTSAGFLNAVIYLFLTVLGYVFGRIMDAFRHAAVELNGVIVYPDSTYRIIFLGCIVLALCSFLTAFRIKETGNGQ